MKHASSPWCFEVPPSWLEGQRPVFSFLHRGSMNRPVRAASVAREIGDVGLEARLLTAELLDSLGRDEQAERLLGQTTTASP